MKSNTYLELNEDKQNFEKINKYLEKNGFAYIYGLSGNGKSTMAREFAFQVSDKYLIQFIESKDFSSNMTKLTKFLSFHEMNLAKSDQELIQHIKKRIDQEKRKILFIFDDVKSTDEVDNIMKVLNNHKFLITTKNHKLFEKTDPNRELGIEKYSFSQEDCLNYLTKIGIDLSSTRDDWKNLIQKCFEKNLISIKDFENGIDYYRNHICSLEDIYSFITNKSFMKYNVIQKENFKAFDLITRLAYLDRNYLDTEIIKIITDDFNFLVDPLDFLIHNGYLKVKSRNFLKIELEMHEKIQEQLKELLISKGMEKIIIEELINHFEKKINMENVNETIEKINFHAIKINNEWKDHVNTENLNLFLTKLANINKQNRKDYKNSVKLLKFAIENYRKKDLDQKKDNLEKILAEIYEDINVKKLYIYKEQFNDSIKCYEYLININEKSKGKLNLKEKSKILLNLGVLLLLYTI